MRPCFIQDSNDNSNMTCLGSCVASGLPDKLWIAIELLGCANGLLKPGKFLGGLPVYPCMVAVPESLASTGLWHSGHCRPTRSPQKQQIQ